MTNTSKQGIQPGKPAGRTKSLTIFGSQDKCMSLSTAYESCNALVCGKPSSRMVLTRTSDSKIYLDEQNTEVIYHYLSLDTSFRQNVSIWSTRKQSSCK